ncbi:hypothetical protein TKK_0016609 [Trichogramma kaykai]|uniref:Uncharacterized protein n=1 Tax=Trichogramma kaykai TaxID=54128 RepID=A0ABD2W608_9HYME
MRKRSYAVVVMEKGNKEAKQVEEKLKRVESCLGLKVEGMRNTREEKVVVELATEEDKNTLLGEKKIKDAGLNISEPSKYPPLVRIKDLPRGIESDQLFDDLFVRNFKDDVDAHVFEKEVKVKFRMRKGESKEGVVIEMSPDIVKVLL